VFPANTLDEALAAIRRAFGCTADVCDDSEGPWHGKTVRLDTGVMYRGDAQIGTFAVARAKTSDGAEQVVAIHIGSIGEMVANPHTERLFDEWVSQLESGL
jgi:hypothetical protein